MKYEVTSFNTKKMMADSLKKLLKKKSFSKITVVDIISDCNINRNTFYYHFEDINMLLKWMFEQEAIEIIKHFDLMLDFDEAVFFVLEYIEKNKTITLNVFDSLGIVELKRFFYKDFADIVDNYIDKTIEDTGYTVSREFHEFITHNYTELISGMLYNTASNDVQMDKKKILKYVTVMFKNSIMATLKDAHESKL